MEKSYSLNIKKLQICIKRRTSMIGLSEYFQTLQYTMMATVFISLVLIFLYGYYGKEDEQEQLNI
jgi:hypothetical protein